MTKKEFLEFHAKLCAMMQDTTAKKNADYSNGSAEDPFVNFRQIAGLVNIERATEIGFLTRMSDKMSRIGSFVTTNSLQVKDESVQDTLIDLANYCLIFASYLESEKKFYEQNYGTHKARTKVQAGRYNAPLAPEDC